MHIENSSKNLIYEVLDVLIAQLLPRIDDPVHVGLHQICNNVNVLKAPSTLVRFLDIQERYYVLMVEETKKFDFPHYSFGIDEIFKSIMYFLDGNLHVILDIVC